MMMMLINKIMIVNIGHNDSNKNADDDDNYE